MASEVKVDKLSQKGSSGIVITDDIKLSSGKAIKNAAGTDLLTEAGALGTFQAASRPGVRQFIQNTTETATSATFSADTETIITDMNVAITPTAEDSRLLVTFSCGGQALNDTFAVSVHIKRITDGVTTMVRELQKYMYLSPTGWHGVPIFVNYLDTPTIPSTPLEIVYQMYIVSNRAATWEINSGSASASNRVGVVTVMELAPN